MPKLPPRPKRAIPKPQPFPFQVGELVEFIAKNNDIQKVLEYVTAISLLFFCNLVTQKRLLSFTKKGYSPSKPVMNVTKKHIDYCL